MRYIIKNATLVNEGKSFLASVVILGDTIEKIIPADKQQTTDDGLQNYEGYEIIDATGLL